MGRQALNCLVGLLDDTWLPTSETPYAIAFAMEALIPIEAILPSHEINEKTGCNVYLSGGILVEGFDTLKKYGATTEFPRGRSSVEKNF